MITMVLEITNIHKTDLLIETDWLSRHLNDADIRIIDLRSREEYDKAHIKNAVQWKKSMNDDQTFKSPEVLNEM